jgi:hypothetical protein
MSIFAVLTTGGTAVARNVIADDEAGVREQYDMRGKVVVELERALTDFESVGLDGVIIDHDDDRRAHAKALIDRDFCEAHGADAIERARLHKAARAQRVVDGGTCTFIAAEAELRDMTPLALAELILQRNAEALETFELERMRAKLAIDAPEATEA